MMQAYISLGSNMGDKVESLKQAVQLLHGEKEIRVTAVSSIYDTDPVGYEDQDVFMNCIVEVDTSLSALDLLRSCQAIEQKLKRERIIRWGPRTMDLDIILYGEEIHDNEILTIPHARMHERAFVLVPLAEIAPYANQPVLGQSIDALLAELGSQGVRLFKRIENVQQFLQM
ncbi:2-amino-4-hydroxy-6-hydroxymethyldihydropteridine diphosphokinase [Kurthia sibirica]|uniref:2-amino-4-hydroxy-6-hydroxymethyldihydropteridine diphosphokinase n=1 Tax=Kurthia sibirica TaxID=202750 RepID=A0A2U3AI84_9BACL|nr:2-amino-4-hydroxy-6-hydroxymethyldihydropteridine diphosphokinase [Kurthia sibirica]PWI24259.1 2-amino-4-hydroxy-6-hydroxymethyldihydropteridine diphosphokinase [Kurthia sibirica]GEK34508.1 2-amino-4-hydroxy-6-hydroxymethyldihydropteridine pyrophosphokinase [Kurthia sibirica]